MDQQLKEFLAHPTWSLVLSFLHKVRDDLMTKAARETADHARALGRLEGAEMVLQRLETLRKDNRG